MPGPAHAPADDAPDAGEPVESATVMITGAGEPLGRQLATDTARRRPRQLVLVDPDAERLALLAAELPGPTMVVVADSRGSDGHRARPWPSTVPRSSSTCPPPASR